MFLIANDVAYLNFLIVTIKDNILTLFPLSLNPRAKLSIFQFFSDTNHCFGKNRAAFFKSFLSVLSILDTNLSETKSL